MNQVTGVFRELMIFAFDAPFPNDLVQTIPKHR